jgi:copper chaperone CopZ
MSQLKFKTNINCSGCLSKVTPFLNEEKDIQKWEVNLESENRVLTVETSKLNAEEVKNTVQKAGFNAEVI